MPIKGINVDSCNLCGECINECPMGNFNKPNGKIIFDNSRRCILCGHCIAICPENAIIYDDMKDSALDFEEKDDYQSYNAIYKLLRSKRSIRQYKSQKVPKNMIEKVIECIRYAPVGMNKRTLKCLVISHETKINDLIDSIIDTIESEEEREEYKKKRKENIDPFFYNAPHIFILHSNNDWDSKNAVIAITYAMLGAETLGLGSCWIGGVQIFLNENKEIAKNLFSIDDEIFGIMILGYPTVKYYRAPPRPPMETEFISEPPV
ncbi:MAG: nitroreductase family protein [Candidatus Lokiarchaeota archaeon]|nr:nitroreductase family protein [Candidatus Lokiarchaeota archaeon]